MWKVHYMESMRLVPDDSVHMVTMNILVGLFRRYGLEANVDKSLTMTCHPSALWAGMLDEVMALRCTGVGDS